MQVCAYADMQLGDIHDYGNGSCSRVVCGDSALSSGVLFSHHLPLVIGSGF